MMAPSGFRRSWVHSHSTHNTDMALEPDEEVILAYERIKSPFPVRAKTQTRNIYRNFGCLKS
jgi:hypothetical protein